MQPWRRPDVLQHKHDWSVDAAILPLLFQTAHFTGVILRHNVRVIILDTDTGAAFSKASARERSPTER